jgi:lipopolysaccharide export system protein LptC
MSSHTDVEQRHRIQNVGQTALQRARWARLIGLSSIVAGAVVFIYFLLQSGFFSLFVPAVKIVTAPVDVSAQITGTEAVIRGFDKDGLPFTITSQNAKQDGVEKDVVHLVLPTGSFDRSSGSKLNLEAKTAVYNTATKALALEGDVVFEQAGRYKAHMDKASMNLDTMSLSSQSPVHVDLNTGAVDADHLEISDGGKKTIFSGHVKARLETDIKSEIVK